MDVIMANWGRVPIIDFLGFFFAFAHSSGFSEGGLKWYGNPKIVQGIRLKKESWAGRQTKYSPHLLSPKSASPKKVKGPLWRPWIRAVGRWLWCWTALGLVPSASYQLPDLGLLPNYPAPGPCNEQVSADKTRRQSKPVCHTVGAQNAFTQFAFFLSKNSPTLAGPVHFKCATSTTEWF